VRVLLVTGSFPPMVCGVGDYTRSLARALSDLEGVEVAVLTSAEAGLAGGADRFETFPLLDGWLRSEFPVVRDVVRRWRPDVVHLQYPTQGYRGDLVFRLPLLLWRAGIRVVQTWHEYFARDLRPRWQEVALGLAPGDVVVVRPDYRENMPLWYRALTLHRRFHHVPGAPSIPRVVLGQGERREVHQRYAPQDRSLLAFFGFLYPHKGVDDLLAILDPERHHLVLVGDLQQSDPYQRTLLQRIAAPPLAGHVSPTGFLPPLEAARVLAAADAVVLPFRQGGGAWNSSIQAAMLQGTFVLTTSRERHGYDPVQNVYYARPGDRADLRQALDRHLGSRLPGDVAGGSLPGWQGIARQHLAIYERRR
jgi:glycosyltransferase involved in cell wall biosynthesis